MKRLTTLIFLFAAAFSWNTCIAQNDNTTAPAPDKSIPRNRAANSIEGSNENAVGHGAINKEKIQRNLPKDTEQSSTEYARPLNRTEVNKKRQEQKSKEASTPN